MGEVTFHGQAEDRQKGTGHTGLGEIVGVETRSRGAGLHALVGGGVRVVENGRLPGALCVRGELRLTQALSKGSQKREPLQMDCV